MNTLPTKSPRHLPSDDAEIRAQFYKTHLSRYHGDGNSKILHELGLMHGAYRADLVVVNGKLTGYEIKSERDSLARLKRQIPAYDAIFDSVTLIISEKHYLKASSSAPVHWGVIISTKDKSGNIRFKTQRRAKMNPNVDPISLSRLLWKNEALEILEKCGIKKKTEKDSRNTLYNRLTNALSLRVLKQQVREYLLKREGWRDQKQSSVNVDSCQPISTSIDYRDS